MATQPYAPEVPEAGSPSYMNWFRPSQEAGQLAKEGNRGPGTALAGIANAVKSGFEVADEALKTHVRERTSDIIVPERTEFVDFLQSQWDALNTPTPQEAPAQPGLSSGPVAPPPDGLTNGLNNVGKLVNARNQGKVNEMFYLANIDRNVSSLKEQYPGYADVIEHEADRLTHYGVANARMRLLVSQLQAAGSVADKLHDHLITKVLDHSGEPGADDVLMQLQSKGSAFDKEATTWLHRVTADKAYVEHKKLQTEWDSMNDKDKMREALNIYDFQGNSIVQNFMFQTRNSLNGGNIQQYLDAFKNGEFNNSAEDKAKIAASLSVLRAQLESDLRKKSYEPIDGKRTVRDLSGGNEEVEKRIDNLLKNVDAILNPLMDPKSHPIAILNATRAEAQIQDTKWNLQNNPDTGSFFRTVSAMAKDGPGATPIINTIAQYYFQNTTDKVKNMMATGMSSAAFDKFDPNKPVDNSPNKVISDVKNTYKDSDGTPMPFPNDARKMVEFVKQVQDSSNSIDVKKNLVDHYYGDYNLGVLDHFIDDYTDLSGKWHEGKIEMYKKMGGAKQSAAVKALGDEAFAKYENWHQREFAHLFATNIDDLSRVQEMEGAKLSFNDSTLKFKLHYNPPEGGVTGMETERRMFTRAGERYTDPRTIRPFEDSVERLNQGLAVLATVAKAGGWDVKEYLMQVLLDRGYNPAGTPAMRAIMATEKQKEQEALRGLKE